VDSICSSVPSFFSFFASHTKGHLKAQEVSTSSSSSTSFIFELLPVPEVLPSPSMRSIIVSALTFCAAVFAQSVVDQYVTTESPIAKAGILANIGPSGSDSSGAAVCSILRII
jgi:hypothetical protein